MRTCLILSVMLLAACGGAADDDTVGKEIADDYNDALDKAAAVEGQLDAAKSRVDDTVEEADDGGRQ